MSTRKSILPPGWIQVHIPAKSHGGIKNNATSSSVGDHGHRNDRSRRQFYQSVSRKVVSHGLRYNKTKHLDAQHNRVDTVFTEDGLVLAST